MQDILDWIARQGIGNIVWLTDLDKTIVDHDRNTGAFSVAPGLEDTLRELDARTAGFFIITGRSLNTVDVGMFPNTKFKVSAEYHNVARFDPDAEPQRIRPQPAWELINERVAEIANRRDDLFLKAMEYLRAVHYFRVPEDEKDAVREMLRGPLAALVDELNAVPGGPPMEVVDFDDSFDIVPVGTSKGPAVDDILTYMQGGGRPKPVPIYFGDNPGDIPAGKAAQAHGGVFVSVGDDPDVIAAADFHLPDTASARAVYAKAAAMGNAPAPAAPRPQL